MVTKDGDCFEVQQHSGLSLDNLFFEFNGGDEVVLVHPFQPVTNGSSTFVLHRGEELAVPIDSIRVGNIVLDISEQRMMTRTRNRWELPSGTRETILRRLLQTMT